MAAKAKVLENCRVLDLSNELGFLCGKNLGDLGADVIKIEKPGGDPSRNLGTYYKDQPDPEKYNDEVIFPDKVRINREYLENYSLRSDLKMIYETAKAVFKG